MLEPAVRNQAARMVDVQWDRSGQWAEPFARTCWRLERTTGSQLQIAVTVK